MAIAGSHAGTRYVHCIAQIAAVELTDVTRNRKARIVTAPPLARSVTETPRSGCWSCPANVPQSCCETDNGYCDAGTRCAPVAGHCCLDVGLPIFVAGYLLTVIARGFDILRQECWVRTPSGSSRDSGRWAPRAGQRAGSFPCRRIQ
jgi:hypothetical protein